MSEQQQQQQQRKILLTGATGYIGGTILTSLLATHPNLKISCLLRGSDCIPKITATAYGDSVTPILYGGLDHIHDIVFNITPGVHAPSALAVVDGLAQRRAETGKDVWMIHTSEMSNVADTRFTHAWSLPKGERREATSSTTRKMTFTLMKNCASSTLITPSARRSRRSIDAAREAGVKVLVIMSPLIYGVGKGAFDRYSMQIPANFRVALQHGTAVVVGKGKGVWGTVLVEDLAELYTLGLTTHILVNGGADLPQGTKGILFSATGQCSWLKVAQRVAKTAYEAGRIATKDVKSISLEEGARLFGLPDWIVELG